MHRAQRAFHVPEVLPGVQGNEAEDTDLELDGGDTLASKDTRKGETRSRGQMW